MLQACRACADLRGEEHLTQLGCRGRGLWTRVDRPGLRQTRCQCYLRYQGKLFNQADAESLGDSGNLIGSLDLCIIEKRKCSQMLHCGSLNIW